MASQALARIVIQQSGLVQASGLMAHSDTDEQQQLMVEVFFWRHGIPLDRSTLRRGEI